jgi:putative protease
MYDYRVNQVELLSPVGNWASLYAAVQNGCDAVYLGGKSFNARENADNFTVEELEEVFDYAHIRGVKIYVTVNTLYKDSEIKGVLEFIEKIYQYGVDGVILQDLGTAKLVKDNFPNLEIHASTQMTIHNLEGAKYLEELGFSRVVMARELSIAEVKEIADNTDLEIEAFVHGALCISYSGQCLMSSLIGGRSGNRGRCAQPCRLPYSLVDLDSGEVVKEEYAKKYLLSPKDINTLKIIPKLIEAGITSLKIEGRMKRPEYTALVTEKYRKYINEYFENKAHRVLAKDQEEIEQIFNRGGFIPGYYLGKDNLDLISHQRPKNWGIKVGEVLAYNQQTKECKIKLSKELDQGDGIEIWIDGGRNIGMVLSDYQQISKDIISVEIRGKIKKSNPVYRTSQKELLERLQESYVFPDTIKKIEIFGQISAKLGRPMEFNLWDSAGHYVSAQSEFIPEEAQKRAITSEDFREQLSKLGNTPYQLEDLELDIEDNLFVPISKINELRRDAVEKLDYQRSQQFIMNPRNNKIKEDTFNLEPSKLEKTMELAVYLKDLDYIEEVLELGVDRVYCDSRGLQIGEIVDKFRDYQTQLFVKLPQISRSAEMKRVKSQIEDLEKSEISGYLVPHLGAAELLKGTDKSLIADYPLNTFNSYSVKHWRGEDYQSLVLSPELNLQEIKEIARYNNIAKELIIYGHLPMMITEYCPIGTVKNEFSSKKKCQGECSKGSYGLLDRKRMVAPIEANPNSCATIIYNSQPLYLIEYLDEISLTGCQSYRLDFILEDKEEVLEVIRAYQAKLKGEDVDLSELSFRFKKKGYTTGHYYRGVK